jgi:serine/threonine protein kinase
VKLVRDPSTTALIALKTLDHQASDNFMNEVEMLMKLSHPCILRIVGYSLPTPTVPAQIGTEFAQNRSLRDLLRNAARPDDTSIAIIICGIVLGMKFIHSRCIIHRDLKPENILIDEENHAKIGDLGSSRFVNIDRSLTGQVGTPLYMAPEMHDCGYSEMVDSYSFGLILFELLVGQPVWPSTIATLVLIKKSAKWNRPDLPAEMPETIQKIIRRCWAPDPRIRESFSEILDHLEKIRFQITPNVDVGRVKEFVSEVRQYEAR